jgi:cleavage and polyadenylation specificity factor subunit 2
MSTATRFTPLYGVHGGGALCYLLRMGDLTLLLDCGWDDAYDPAALNPLRPLIPEIDAGGSYREPSDADLHDYDPSQ